MHTREAEEEDSSEVLALQPQALLFSIFTASVRLFLSLRLQFLLTIFIICVTDYS